MKCFNPTYYIWIIYVIGKCEKLEFMEIYLDYCLNGFWKLNKKYIIFNVLYLDVDLLIFEGKFEWLEKLRNVGFMEKKIVKDPGLNID